MQKCINDNSLIQNEDHMGNLPWAKGREGIHSPCSQPHPLRILSETPSRNNMTPWGAMMTNTYNGLRCGSKGIKMWMSSRIYSIPKARSWASNIWKNVVPQLFAQIHPGGNKVPRHPPHLVQRTGMLPRLSKNLNKISETLDLWIRSIGNVPPNQRTKNKTKARLPKQLVEAASEEQHHEAKEGHKEVSSIKVPLTTQMSVRPSNHWWPSWRPLSHMHVRTLRQNPTRGMTKASRLSMWSPVPLWPPPRSSGDPEDPKKGEWLFHYQMWVKGSTLQFIVDSESQKNLISTKVVKWLGLSTTTRPQPYTIEWLHQRWDLHVSQQCTFPTTSSP